LEDTTILAIITILIGSPRKNGSTAIRARDAERELMEQRIQTEVVLLKDLSSEAAKPDITARRTM
jgi:multimeric flavodoxin WrbA